MRFLFHILNFSFQFGFSLVKYFLFLFSCLEMFLFIQLFVFIQSSLRHPFMPSLRDLDILIIAILRFLCASAKLNFSGPVTIWLLTSGGGILSWVFMSVLWYLDLNIWSYGVGGGGWPVIQLSGLVFVG